MQVALISISNCPSLATRNIQRYCLAHEDVRAAVAFEIYDYDVREFRDARTQSSRQWSYVTKIDAAVDEITRLGPDLIAFSCYLWNTELSLHLAHLLKRLLPDALTVFGGPDAGPRAAELLARHPQVDLVVDGDGELPFLALVRQLLADRRDLAVVPALRYRGGSGLVANPPSAQPVDLSLLRDLYDPPPSPGELGAWYWPNVLYETLRGCPYQCSYCMYGKTRLNEKDPDLAVEELAALLGRGLTVEIIDPTFTTFKKRAQHILRGLAGRDYSGRLQFETYADSIDGETAELMARTRVSCVGIGFQTLSGEGLKAVKRPKNLTRFERGIRLLEKHGIHFYVDLIYGLPRTTVEDFLATVDYLYSLGVTRLMIYRLLGLPGSPMMADVEKYGLVFSEIPPYELLSSNTYTLRDLIFCDRFQHAYEKLLGLLGRELKRHPESVPKISELVRRFMANGLEDPEAFKRGVAKTWTDSPSRRRQDTRAASTPASRSGRGSAPRAVPSAL